MSDLSQLTDAVTREGFCVVPQALDEATLAALERALAEIERGAGVRRRGGVYAIRHLLAAVPAVRALAASRAARRLVEPILGGHCFAVRGVFFDKTPEAPWKVAWHQDLSIAVRERREVAGFQSWSVKAGVAHAQPPAGVLEKMIALRLHLDDCDETNGALRVLPGSHGEGRLGPDDIERWRREGRPVTCVAPRGSALLMRPLLLHSSSSPRSSRRRRVIHLEFAADALPSGLEWQV